MGVISPPSFQKQFAQFQAAHAPVIAPVQMPRYLNHPLSGICTWSTARADRRGVFS